MKNGFTTYSYEVLTYDSDRWILDTMHTAKWRAIERAETLVAENQNRAVRVTSANNEGRQQIEVIFECGSNTNVQKVITISRVDEAPLCKDLFDYYKFESRRVIGRLLKTFLDERQITALELLFGAEHINAFERNERLMNQAVQRIATLQAKESGLTSVKIGDQLDHVIRQIRERSIGISASDEELGILAKSGPQALMSHLAGTYAPEEKYLQVFATLAAYLEEAPGFESKLALMVDFLDGSSDKEALGLIDETIVEILYGGDTVLALLNHEPVMAEECLSLIRLCRGKAILPKKPHASLPALNDAMARHELPLTRNVLLRRVQVHVRSIKSLVVDDDKRARDVLVKIIRELRVESGLLGGPGMCEAVTMRAKTTLSHGYDDLSLPESIESVLALLPSPASRLGYLLDLSQSPVMSKNHVVMEEQLQETEGKLITLSSLLPGADDPTLALETLTHLMHRLENGVLPKPLKDSLSVKIKRFIDVCEAAVKTGKGSTRKNSDGEDNKMSKTKISKDNKSVTAGTCIFTVGDEAQCAYLVKSGNVEISIIKDDTKVILTTLGPSQIFGELALLDGSPRSATATALSDCEFVVVTQKTFENQIEKLDGFMKSWLLYLGVRIRDLTDKVDSGS